MRRWYYIDITMTCHERVAVRAEDEEQAKDIVGTLVDGGTINFSAANKSAYGSTDDSIVAADKHYHAPPRGMRKFEQAYAARPLEEVI